MPNQQRKRKLNMTQTDVETNGDVAEEEEEAPCDDGMKMLSAAAQLLTEPPPTWLKFKPIPDEGDFKCPRLDKKHFRVKKATVASISQFLKDKLHLSFQSQVDIICLGKQLSPEITLNGIRDIWRESHSGEAKTNWDLQEVVIELGYKISKDRDSSKEN